MTKEPSGTIRMAALSDTEKLLSIYNPYITDTTITFEYEPLSTEVFQKRLETVLKQFPWLVYEEKGRLLGYAYASPFHERAAYSWDCDLSIYLEQDCRGRGIGQKLLAALELLLKEQGYYNLYSLITDPNPVSVAFHKKHGFTEEGLHQSTGYKFGQWLGVRLMVKKIGDFTKPPTPVKNIHEIPYNELLEAISYASNKSPDR